MKRAKRATIYVAAGLFVAAAAAKLLFPARTSETIRTIEKTLHRAGYQTEETVTTVTEGYGHDQRRGVPRTRGTDRYGRTVPRCGGGDGGVYGGTAAVR